jgi:glycosyltransferase involved in cell wall biosynthesis
LITEESQKHEDARPLLTIAIPTYNRACFLKELLSVLYDQLVSMPCVELIISDNASADETPAVVQGYKELGLQFRYLRNAINLGADGNILQCFEQASGKYVWIVGDDDVVVADAIQKIVTYLEEEEYDLVYVSSYAFEGPSTPRSPSASRKPTKIEDVTMFVSRIHVFLTFISGNIVNKDRVLASKSWPLPSLVGTNLGQLSWMYTALNGFSRGLYIHERLVGARINNTGGYKLFQTFGPNLKTITETRLQNRALQRLIINGTLQTFWPGMLLNFRRSSAHFEKEADTRDILTPVFKSNIRYWIFVYPMLVTPLAIARCWLFVLRVLNRADKSLGSMLMK